jgi:FeS assembly SUF system protein
LFLCKENKKQLIMSHSLDILATEAKILKVLKNIYDPEIPVNIFDLGLIYEVDVEDDGKTTVKMTLTAPNCPMADQLLQEVNDRVAEVKGIKEVIINLTFDPPWDKNMMSEEAMLELGFL